MVRQAAEVTLCIRLRLRPVYDICRLQTADCRLQTADRRLQTADCRLHEAARL